MDCQFARLLDANANRAREGFRTAEDFARFVLCDAPQAESLRLLRQGITSAILGVPELNLVLLQNRNVATDPLQPELWADTIRSNEAEAGVDVAQRGLKRAQEALRVLEEFARGTHVALAEQFSKLRYQAYACEQKLMSADHTVSTLASASVYVLLTSAFCKNKDPIKTAEIVLKAGVKVIQLREKDHIDAEVLPLLREIRSMCMYYDSILIQNDRVDLALLSQAHGVHFGQTDVTPAEARQLCGQRLVIGRSTHSVDQALHAVNVERADYIGYGSMYPTDSKAQLLLKGVKLGEEIAALKLSVPAFAIGGITVERVPELRKVGVTHIAVSQAIIASESPERETKRFIEAMAA